MKIARLRVKWVCAHIRAGDISYVPFDSNELPSDSILIMIIS